jgi:hypothetical protein
MLILKNSRLIKVPYTGADWVEQCLIKGAQENKQHPAIVLTDTYVPWNLAPGRGLFTFTFVRNPIIWYQEYWLTGVGQGWCSNGIDSDLRGSSFVNFIDNVINLRLGLATELFKQASNNWEIDFIGKYERLEKDLIEIIDRIDESLPIIKPVLPKPLIKMNPMKYDLKYTKEQLDTIIQSDLETIQKFNYTKDVENGYNRWTLNGVSS